MTIKLTFYGAAQNVTGSRSLLETGSRKIFVDCGIFQEHEFLRRNWEPFGVKLASLDAVLLTHAHLDHCGLVPRLVKEGYKKPIYCTAGTADIAEISLLDSGRIQEEDAAFKKKRHQREGRKGPYPEVALYTYEDARAAIPYLTPVEYGKTLDLGEGMNAVFYDAGHVLGSAMIKVTVKEGGKSKTIVFSGDIGRAGSPMQDDPATFEGADYVVMETTYGGEKHEDEGKAAERLAQIINETARVGGNIVIPSFALERAQNVLFHLNNFMLEKRIPKLLVFLDSPMAVDITSVFAHHPEYLNQNMRDLIKAGKSPFKFPQLTLVTDVDQSKAINSIRGSAIIIAGSGMATGGRIKHHLVNNITRPENSIVFVGYQAKNTLGRQITDGAKEVRILGQNYAVRAHIEKIDGFSAHADNEGLLSWLSAFKKPPKSLFLVHSEADVTRRFAKSVTAKFGWQPVIPEYKSEYLL